VNIFLIVGFILSALIGLSLGLIGGGGSLITVPVMVYVLGVGAHDAVGMSLAVVGATSLVGTFLHYQRGAVRLKTGSIFGLAGIVGALVGSPLSLLLSPAALMLSFAMLLLLVASLMLRPDAGDEIVETVEKTLVPWKALAAGFGVGVLTGFLGVGGGFLIVPALVMFGGLGMKDAIGTSLFVIFVNCVGGLVGHAGQNNFDWNLAAFVTAFALTGTIFGTLISHRVASRTLQKGFAVFVLGVAVFLVSKNYSALFGG
jgi:uncharacterized protein